MNLDTTTSTCTPSPLTTHTPAIFRTPSLYSIIIIPILSYFYGKPSLVHTCTCMRLFFFCVVLLLDDSGGVVKKKCNRVATRCPAIRTPFFLLSFYSFSFMYVCVGAKCVCVRCCGFLLVENCSGANTRRSTGLHRKYVYVASERRKKKRGGILAIRYIFFFHARYFRGMCE